MSKRKGLSFDEKKAVLLGAMHAEASFYTLKELEALGKSKGVIPQAVKDVVEGLAADGSVQNDKVGSQSIFWALSSDQLSALKNKKRRLVEDNEKLKLEIKRAQEEIDAISRHSLPSEQEVTELRGKTAAGRKECAELSKQVEALQRCGPGHMSDMRDKTKVAKEAANRWADNICAVRTTFLREVRGDVNLTQFNQVFGLPEDFDYLE